MSLSIFLFISRWFPLIFSYANSILIDYIFKKLKKSVVCEKNTKFLMLFFKKREIFQEIRDKLISGKRALVNDSKWL